jgi:hypothetical protein
MQHVHAPTKAFTAGGALEQYRQVRLATGVLAYAGDSDTDALGFLDAPAFAAGDIVAVRLRTAEGTVIGIASEAISAGGTCYAAASGKVASTGTVVVGVAINAATANGDQIEILPAVNTAFGAVARTSFTQDNLAPYPIDLTLGRVHDAVQTPLPASAANDDLAVIAGTFGTDAVGLQTIDFKAANTTAYARFRVAVPVEYVAGETITLRINGGMVTTVSDGTCTVDAQVYRAAAPTVDICATAAQTINSLTAGNDDFTLTPTNVVPGDILDIRLAIAGADTATGTAVIGRINSATLLLDIKG